MGSCPFSVAQMGGDKEFAFSALAQAYKSLIPAFDYASDSKDELEGATVLY